MENEIDNVNFTNSINQILQEFFMTDFSNEEIDDPLFNVWCVFDFDDSFQAMKAIEDNNLDNKPIIHFSKQPTNTSHVININQEQKGEVHDIEYNVFIIINNNYESNRRRYDVLNELADKFKKKVDNFRINLNDFRHARAQSGGQIIESDMDSWDVINQGLSFEVTRPL